MRAWDEGKVGVMIVVLNTAGLQFFAEFVEAFNVVAIAGDQVSRWDCGRIFTVNAKDPSRISGSLQ